ncbi:MAG: tetratricopeptide repeat protein [Myxococcota bacterium]|nr:tetratricopeptide repeat protein [Myxococcota bacterium]
MIRNIAIFSLFMVGCKAHTGPHPQARALVNQGAAYLKQGNWSRAREAFKLCLEYTPDYHLCLNGLGNAAWQAGEREEAARWYRQSIKSNGDFPEARNNLGAYFLERQTYDRALELFTSALQIDPGYLDARYNLAFALVSRVQRNKARGVDVKKDLDDAEVQLIRLTELAPQRPDARALLASVYQERAALVPETAVADNERARITIEQCLMAAPAYSDCLVLGAFLSHQLNRCEEASQRLAELRRLEADMSPVKDLEVQVQSCIAARNDQVRRAESNWRDQAARGNMQPLRFLCATFVDQRNVEKAISYCEEALRQDTDFISTRVTFARFLVDLQHSQRALEVCEPVLSRPRSQDPAGIDACAEITRVLRLGGDR